MGICESKNNSDTNNNKPQIEIEEDKNSENRIEIKNGKDAVFPGDHIRIPEEILKKISNQKVKSICKIIKNEVPKGTGFLCYIGRYKKIKSLITAYHVLGEEDLKIGNEIKITFNDNNEEIKIIKIDGPRHIYASKKDDIIIIEILDSDKLKNYNVLEIDEYLYNNDIDFYNEYKNKRIYILHYPEGNFLTFSKNFIVDIDENNTIYHIC